MTTWQRHPSDECVHLFTDDGDYALTIHEADAWDTLTADEKADVRRALTRRPEPECKCGHPGFEHWIGTSGTPCDLCGCDEYQGRKS